MTLGNKIASLRKQMGLTQEALAQKLEVTNQAVSKWESDQCCPDITLLPRIADVFGITIDELFGREPAQETKAEPEPAPKQEKQNGSFMDDLGGYILSKLENSFGKKASSACKDSFSFEKTFHVSLNDLSKDAQQEKEKPFSAFVEELEQEAKEQKPSWKFQEVNWEQFDVSKMDWEDDGVLRVLLFAGRKLLMGTPIAERIEFRYEGPALNVYSQCNLTCDNANGNVYAGGNVTCDEVAGHVDALGNVTCDDVNGPVSAGGNVTCDAVMGSVSAGGTVTCDEINGATVHSMHDIECDELNDCTVQVGGDLRCEEVHGGSIEYAGTFSTN